MAQGGITIATLVGSLRRDSLNAALACALPALMPEGAAIVPLGSIGAFPIYDADMQEQGFPAPVTAMADAIRAADGVLIVSPEYNYSMPGGLKNAIDWLSRLPDQPFRHKPVAIQSASPGSIGGARMQHHLRQTLVFLDALAMAKPEVMIGGAHMRIDPAAGVITDETTRDHVVVQLAAFVAFIRKYRP